MCASWTSPGVARRSPPRHSGTRVDVTGLEPDRWYYFRFIAGGEVSPSGRTRTFPPVGSPVDRLRFAFASCQHYGQGYFTAYEAMMEDDLDPIVHLGDYIYESDWGPKVRFHLPEPISLLKQDFGDPSSPTMATEFVGTSVTSKGVSYDVFNGYLPENPHIRFFGSRERGYVLVDISPELWRTDLRRHDHPQPEATARTLGSYVVEQGKAGAQEA
jgi:phosphodiesterase/alkaline phosphatase D-like protein